MLHYKTQRVYKKNFRTHVLQIQSDIYIYIYIQMKRIEVNGVGSCNSEFFVHFKLSYSCMSKVKSIISRHNKAQIGKPLNQTRRNQEQL